MSSVSPPRTLNDFELETFEDDLLTYENEDLTARIRFNGPGWLVELGEIFPGVDEEFQGRILDVAETADDGIEFLREITDAPLRELRQRARGMGDFAPTLNVTRLAGNEITGRQAAVLEETFRSEDEIAALTNDQLLTLPRIGQKTVEAIRRNFGGKNQAEEFDPEDPDEIEGEDMTVISGIGEAFAIDIAEQTGIQTAEELRDTLWRDPGSVTSVPRIQWGAVIEDALDPVSRSADEFGLREDWEVWGLYFVRQNWDDGGPSLEEIEDLDMFDTGYVNAANTVAVVGPDMDPTPDVEREKFSISPDFALHTETVVPQASDITENDSIIVFDSPEAQFHSTIGYDLLETAQTALGYDPIDRKQLWRMAEESDFPILLDDSGGRFSVFVAPRILAAESTSRDSFVDELEQNARDVIDDVGLPGRDLIPTMRSRLVVEEPDDTVNFASPFYTAEDNNLVPFSVKQEVIEEAEERFGTVEEAGFDPGTIVGSFAFKGRELLDTSFDPHGPPTGSEEEDPIETWEDGSGQQVFIFEDRVVAERDGELNIEPEEAARRAREQDRFEPVMVPADSPLVDDDGDDEEQEEDDDTVALPDRVDQGRWDVAVVVRPDNDFRERHEARLLADSVRKNPSVEVGEGTIEEIEDDAQGIPAWQYDDGDVVAVYAVREGARGGVRIQAQSYSPGVDLLRERTTDDSGNLTVTSSDGWVGVHPESLLDADVGDLSAGWVTAPIKANDSRSTFHVGWEGERAYHYRELREPPYFVYEFDRNEEWPDLDDTLGPGGGNPPTKRWAAVYRTPANDEVIGLEPRSDEGPKPGTPIFASEFEAEYDLNPTITSGDDVSEIIEKDVLVRTAGGFLHETTATTETVSGTGFRVPDRVSPDGVWYVPTSSKSDDNTIELVGVRDDSFAVESRTDEEDAFSGLITVAVEPGADEYATEPQRDATPLVDEFVGDVVAEFGQPTVFRTSGLRRPRAVAIATAEDGKIVERDFTGGTDILEGRNIRDAEQSTTTTGAVSAEPPEPSEGLSADEVQRVVGGSTQGVSVSVKEALGQVVGITMRGTGEVGLSDDEIVVSGFGGGEALARRAIGEWAIAADRQDVDAKTLEDRRLVLENEFRIDLPAVDVEESRGPADRDRDRDRDRGETDDDQERVIDEDAGSEEERELFRLIQEGLRAANFPVSDPPGSVRFDEREGRFSISRVMDSEWERVMSSEPFGTFSQSAGMGDEEFVFDYLDHLRLGLESERREAVDMSAAAEFLGVEMEGEPVEPGDEDTDEVTNEVLDTLQALEDKITGLQTQVEEAQTTDMERAAEFMEDAPSEFNAFVERAADPDPDAEPTSVDEEVETLLALFGRFDGTAGVVSRATEEFARPGRSDIPREDLTLGLPEVDESLEVLIDAGVFAEVGDGSEVVSIYRLGSMREAVNQFLGVR
jgi:hypothetical protein